MIIIIDLINIIVTIGASYGSMLSHSDEENYNLYLVSSSIETLVMVLLLGSVWRC